MMRTRAAALGCLWAVLIVAGCSRSDSDRSNPTVGTVELDAATNFEAGLDLQDLVVACPSERLYTLEFDFAGHAFVKTFGIAFDGTLSTLFNADLSAALGGNLANDLSVFSDSNAVLVAQAPFGGNGEEALYAFDPRSASPSTSFRDVSADSLSAPFVDMAGDTMTLLSEAGDTLDTVTISFLEDAVAYGARLFAVSSNVQFSAGPTVRQPGTILVYGYDRSSNTILSNEGVIFTGKSGTTASGVYNPVKLEVATVSGRDVLIVTSAGSFSGDGTVEIIDLSSFETIASLAVSGAPLSNIAVDEAGGFIYLGDGLTSVIHALQLSFPRGSASLSAVAGSPFDLPDGLGGTGSFVGGLEVSDDGTRLAAVNFMGNELTVFSLTGGVPTAIVSESLQHDTGLPGSTTQRSVALGMRCGVAGIDYSGPDVYLGVIDLDPSAQTVSGVGSGLDAAFAY